MKKRRQDEDVSGVLWFLITPLRGGGVLSEQPKAEESRWATSKEHIKGNGPMPTEPVEDCYQA